jgi:hypothetical protein
VPDGGKIMLLAVTDISKAGNTFANASGIERMATSWLKTIDAPHNHFPSFTMRSFNAKIIIDLEFSRKEVSYLMRDCIFLKVLAILLDKLKIKINNTTLHWHYISCRSTLFEKLNTLKWDVDIKFGCSNRQSFFDILLRELPNVLRDELW